MGLNTVPGPGTGTRGVMRDRVARMAARGHEPPTTVEEKQSHDRSP